MGGGGAPQCEGGSAAVCLVKDPGHMKKGRSKSGLKADMTCSGMKCSLWSSRSRVMPTPSPLSLSDVPESSDLTLTLFPTLWDQREASPEFHQLGNPASHLSHVGLPPLLPKCCLEDTAGLLVLKLLVNKPNRCDGMAGVVLLHRRNLERTPSPHSPVLLVPLLLYASLCLSTFRRPPPTTHTPLVCLHQLLPLERASSRRIRRRLNQRREHEVGTVQRHRILHESGQLLAILCAEG